MSLEYDAPRSLRDLEQEVEAKGREWMRRRLEEKLQAEAFRHGGVSPHSQRKAHHRRAGPMQLRTAFGVVALQVWHGKKTPVTAVGAVRSASAGVWGRTSNSARRWKTNWPTLAR